MKTGNDLGPIVLIVAVVAGLAANHAGWNPWLWGLVTGFGFMVLLAALIGYVGD